ncbi:SDR family NAD(P)-dependent oxidoreductase [Mesorhizobium australicum]|uniref:NAD(P)-dependent dehydrogenase, short-chain alcohol dehydrogenase family n=1 Tax=Mesorhizobium australicum TaxID=536018 RepID=A0A1X7PZY4_9HYPH|nr:glucose 1-dehydrogenase [Mesorhizobium australicum]SMH57308.1 NAD(P)-dependent dehydrogenase, short-chain alcohol dehydrogenase family [Mesorhizobium australicum]
MEFKDKTVLITGAAGGIGKAATKAFFEQGAKLVLIDLAQPSLDTMARELTLDPDRCVLIAADVSKESEVESFVAATKAKFGRIDVFFNNAGVEGKTGLLIDTDADTLDKILDVNVKGCFFGLKYVLREMIAQGGGAVVNTSSMAGLIGFHSLGVYTASKHAVIGLTRAAAAEVAASKVRVNAVCPGPVETRMMREIEAGISATDPVAVKGQFENLTGLKRYAEPEEIADLVLFLASDKASYITGSMYTIDGGMTGM